MRKPMQKRAMLGGLLVFALMAGPATAIEWEVWLSDQSNSADIGSRNPTGTYGSRILVYESRDIAIAPPGTYAEDHPVYAPTVIQAHHVFPHALRELGVNVERLHGMLTHPSHRYMSANFFGPDAGLVGIVDAEGQCVLTVNGDKVCRRISGSRAQAARLAKALFRTTGPEGAGPSNHMSFWMPDGGKLIVANLGAKLLERIDYDRAADTFTFNRAATLDLVGGRDLSRLPARADSTLPAGRVGGEYVNFQSEFTPSGALKEGEGRPNNVVICPIPSSNGRHVYVTFGGGGLFVVDVTTEPMSIVGEYTNDVIGGAGCGGAEGGGFMHLNAGISASAAGADDSVFALYRLPLDYPHGDGPITVRPNEPPPVIFFEERTMDLADEQEMEARRDAHGMTVSPTRRWLYQFDRIRNNAEVFDLGKIATGPGAALEESSRAHAGTLDLTGSGFCIGEGLPYVDQDGEGYEFANDPAPDLVDISPDGRRLIVSFRGPHPVTVKHAAAGSCPGFGVVTLEGDGSTGRLTHVFRTLLPDATRTMNLSDIHAAAVRIKGPNVPRLCRSWQGCSTHQAAPVEGI